MNNIKPTDCLMAFTIPMDQRQFFLDMKNQEKDFVRNCCSSWAKYKSEILDTIKSTSTEYKKYGVAIQEFVTIEEFANCFKDSVKHLVLIAHWNNGMVEFQNRMATYREVANSIPVKYNGVIDLCICNPIELVTEIKKVRPDCSIRFNETPTSLGLWLYYYLAFFKYISSVDVSFNIAFENVTKEFLAQIK